jgi:hypothetical protein
MGYTKARPKKSPIPWIVAIAVAVGAGIGIVIYFFVPTTQPQGMRVSGDVGTYFVTNTDNSPLRITRVVVNGSDLCDPLQSKYPVTLAIGESAAFNDTVFHKANAAMMGDLTGKPAPPPREAIYVEVHSNRRTFRYDIRSSMYR